MQATSSAKHWKEKLLQKLFKQEETSAKQKADQQQ